MLLLLRSPFWLPRHQQRRKDQSNGSSSTKVRKSLDTTWGLGVAGAAQLS